MDALSIGSPLLYAAFSAAVVLLLIADFVLLRAQGNHKVPVREAATPEWLDWVTTVESCSAPVSLRRCRHGRLLLSCC